MPEHVQKVLEKERKRLDELSGQAKNKKQKKLLKDEKNSLKPKHVAMKVLVCIPDKVYYVAWFKKIIVSEAKQSL